MAWCGLKESGRLDADLAEFGYHESKSTSGFLNHKTRPINFTLVVDDFGAKHKKSLKCCVKVDVDAKQHVAIDLDWNCEEENSSECVQTASEMFQHTLPKQFDQTLTPSIVILLCENTSWFSLTRDPTEATYYSALLGFCSS